MTSSSVSFRISRHTQDLAETVHALSQRLVTLEQRLLALEDEVRGLREQPRHNEESEAASLAPVEAHISRLLQDCRLLLGEQPTGSESSRGSVAAVTASSVSSGTQRSEDGSAPQQEGRAQTAGGLHGSASDGQEGTLSALTAA